MRGEEGIVVVEGDTRRGGRDERLGARVHASLVATLAVAASLALGLVGLRVTLRHDGCVVLVVEGVVRV